MSNDGIFILAVSLNFVTRELTKITGLSLLGTVLMAVKFSSFEAINGKEGADGLRIKK